MLAARRALGSSRGIFGKQSVPHPACSLSTAPHVAASDKVETVTFLRLNNLHDNPGAVKKVSQEKELYD